MKTIMIILFSFATLKAPASEVSVSFSDIRSDKGYIFYLLFDGAEGFPDNEKKSVRQGRVEAKVAKSEGIVFQGPEKGQYALSIFHDENSNSKLDTNFLGIPKEGFGFSQNPKVLFGPPSFKKSRFKLDKKTDLNIKVIYFL